MTLAFAFRYFDPIGKGTVRREDFKAGLKALNASNNGPSPATDDQLEILCDFIDADKDGNIDYQEFLNAFSTKGKSGSSRPSSSQGPPK